MNYFLKLTKRKSKEKNNVYSALCLDLGYKSLFISCDSLTIAEILNVTALEVNQIIDSLDVNCNIKVGSVTVSDKTDLLKK